MVAGFFRVWGLGFRVLGFGAQVAQHVFLARAGFLHMLVHDGFRV